LSTPEDFLLTGQRQVTIWAETTQRLREWAEAYDARGGANTFTQDAADLIGLTINPLLTAIDAAIVASPSIATIIARQRTDL